MRFLPLLLTVFIDSLGFGLIFPILSPLILNNEGGLFGDQTSLATRGWVFGLLISCFCIGQFFGGPILGALSDRIGRKKILFASLWMALASYLLAGTSLLGQSLTGLLLARILSGLAASNYPIAQSMVVDSSEEKDKAKNFGLLGMAWGVGFVLGPYLGGKLSDANFMGFNDLATPFWFAAALCALNLAMLPLCLKETLVHKQQTTLSLLAGIQHLKKAFQHPKLQKIFIVVFIFSLGWGFFTEFSPVFLIRHFEFTRSQIGNFYAYVGLCVAVCQGILIRPFLKKFSTDPLFASALFSLGLILPLMLLVPNASYLFGVLPLLALAESLIMTTASTLVSNYSDKSSQGEMLGIHNSIQWSAIGITPLFSGSFVALYPHLPITVASCCMLLASLFFLMVRKKRSRVEV